MGKWAHGMAGSGFWTGWAASSRQTLSRFGHGRTFAAGLAEVALLGSAGALLTMLCWVLLAPLDPAAGDDAGGLVVLDAPARAALFAQFDPFARESAGSHGDALSLTLLGTRSTPDGRDGSAILAGADGVQHVVAQGDDAMPGVRLAQVAFDHVVLLRAGGRMTLSLAPQDGTAPAAAPTSASRPPAGAGGFTVVTLGGATALALAGGGGQDWGLLPDDRIVAIGGAPVRGQEDASRLDTALAAGRAVTVTVRRGGRDLALSLGPRGGGQ